MEMMSVASSEVEGLFSNVLMRGVTPSVTACTTSIPQPPTKRVSAGDLPNKFPSNKHPAKRIVIFPAGDISLPGPKLFLSISSGGDKEISLRFYIFRWSFFLRKDLEKAHRKYQPRYSSMFSLLFPYFKSTNMTYHEGIGHQLK